MTIAISNPSVQGDSFSDRMINGSLTAAVGSSALTISLKTNAGADPATGSVAVFFRDVTQTAGDYVRLDNMNGATSLVISSGSTMGTTSNVPFRLWIVGFNDGGTFRLGAINCRTSSQITPLWEDQLKSSTAEGGAGAADSSGVIYTGTAVTSKAFRVLGYMTWNSGLGTAGTWSATPDVIQLMGPGVPMPGQIIQNAVGTSNSQATNNTTSYADTNLTVTMTVQSAANPVDLYADGAAAIDTNSTFGFWAITRGGSVLGFSRPAFITSGAIFIAPIAVSVTDFPGASGSTTWKVRQKVSSGGAVATFPLTGGGGDGGANMIATERMG